MTSEKQQTDLHKQLLTPSLLLLAELLGSQNFRFVGGAVRDAILERPIHDIDLATSLMPEDVMQLVEEAGYKSIPTGLSHGTITAVVKGETFEITTLRKDLVTDGRRAEVAFTDDWVEDAARRDFTMNALSLSVDGVLYDPFGGVGHCQQGKIRFVGMADRRIQEDYLRILRLFRFQGQLGRQPLKKEDLIAVAQNHQGIKNMSGERLWQEFAKILVSPGVAQVLPLMIETQVLSAFLDSPFDIEKLLNLATLETTHSATSPLSRLARLLTLEPNRMKSAAKRLKLSRKEKDSLLAFAVTPNDNIYHDLVFDGGEIALRRLLIQAACTGSLNSDSLTIVQNWKQPSLPVTGKDLRDQGLDEGKEIGEALRRLQNWWIARSCTPDRQACLDFLRTDLFSN